jgi:hypothetical protein
MKIETVLAMEGAYSCDLCGKTFHASVLWAHSQILIVGKSGGSQLFDICPTCAGALHTTIKETLLKIPKKQEEPILDHGAYEIAPKPKQGE